MFASNECINIIYKFQIPEDRYLPIGTFSFENYLHYCVVIIVIGMNICGHCKRK